MAKRIKRTLVQAISTEQFNDALSAYAVADAREAKINADMDVQFTRIRDKYSDELKQLKEVKDSEFEVVQAYCEENQDRLFSKKKSMETAHGTVGFRTGTPKLKTLRGFTWASVLTLLQKLKPEYVRIKEEPNKELLLVDREKLKTDLPDLGLQVDQDETFFIELKKEAE